MYCVEESWYTRLEAVPKVADYLRVYDLGRFAHAKRLTKQKEYGKRHLDEFLANNRRRRKEHVAGQSAQIAQQQRGRRILYDQCCQTDPLHRLSLKPESNAIEIKRMVEIELKAKHSISISSLYQR